MELRPLATGFRALPLQLGALGGGPPLLPLGFPPLPLGLTLLCLLVPLLRALVHSLRGLPELLRGLALLLSVEPEELGPRDGSPRSAAAQLLGVPRLLFGVAGLLPGIEPLTGRSPFLVPPVRLLVRTLRLPAQGGGIQLW